VEVPSSSARVNDDAAVSAYTRATSSPRVVPSTRLPATFIV
jgi:hypothetical protein